MALRVRVDGVDITARVQRQDATVSYTDELETRSTLQISDINALSNELAIVPGESVVLEDVLDVVALASAEGTAVLTVEGTPIMAEDVETIFGGTADRVSHRMMNDRDSTWRKLSLEAVSFDQLMDRHIVAALYEDELAGDIVRDLVSEHLAADGVTADGVQDGPAVSSILFNYLSLTEAMNKLSERTGMIGWIDDRRVFHWQTRDTTVAPFSITNDDYHARSLTVVTHRERYRNRQIIRAGRDLTDPLVETFKGDGARTTFNVAFPAGTEPTITLDTGSGPVVQTVGIRGVETGFEWYWNKDTTEISQDESGVVLTSSHFLSVTYRGLFPVVVVLQDDAEVTARQAVEGGSGIYERVADEPNIDSAQIAADAAFAMLQRDGRIPNVIAFVTREKGVYAGQLVPVNLPREGLNGDFLITSVRANFMFNDMFESTVSATDGGYLGGWVEFFRKLTQLRAQAVREDETLINIRTLSAPVLCGDDLDLVAGAPENRIGIMQIGTGEIAA